MKFKFELTAQELTELGNSVADASRSDLDFTTIRDRKTRKIFEKAIERRHKLWLKIIHIADRQ